MVLIINLLVGQCPENTRISPEENRVINPKVTSRPDPSAQVDPDCIDQHKHCQLWADNRYCSTNAAYMSKYCQASCNLCVTKDERRSEVSGGDRSEEVTAKIPESCKDKSTACEGWKNAGFCEARPDVMNVRCPVACNVCGEMENVPKRRPGIYNEGAGRNEYDDNLQREIQVQTDSQGDHTGKSDKPRGVIDDQRRSESRSTQCQDQNSFCTVWKGAGRCETRKEYMEQYCPVSCNSCSSFKGVSMSGSQNEESCKDSSQYCDLWATSERCTTYSGFMKVNCPKSCGFCAQQRRDDVSVRVERPRTEQPKTNPSTTESSKAERTECEDTNGYCQAWADKGFCSKRPEFMERACPKSCDYCN